LRPRVFSLVQKNLEMILSVFILSPRSKVGIERPPPVAFCWSRFWRVLSRYPVTCTAIPFGPSSSSRSTSAACSRRAASTCLIVRIFPLEVLSQE
jgi:hypothetical protein